MGRGNVCVHGPCEGLYYIDTDDFQVYVSNEAEPETKLLGELDYSMLICPRFRSRSWGISWIVSRRDLSRCSPASRALGRMCG